MAYQSVLLLLQTSLRCMYSNENADKQSYAQQQQGLHPLLQVAFHRCAPDTAWEPMLLISRECVYMFAVNRNLYALNRSSPLQLLAFFVT